MIGRVVEDQLAHIHRMAAARALDRELHRFERWMLLDVRTAVATRDCPERVEAIEMNANRRHDFGAFGAMRFSQPSTDRDR